MVTIIPIEVDEDIVREGLQLAIAERLAMTARQISELATELRQGGLIERPKWQQAFDSIAANLPEHLRVLEFAKAFLDQWPDDGEGEP